MTKMFLCDGFSDAIGDGGYNDEDVNIYLHSFWEDYELTRASFWDSFN